MSKTNINPEAQSHKPKLCKLAVASIALVILSFLGVLILAEVNSVSFLARDCLCFLGLLLGLISGIKSLVDISKSNKELTGTGLAVSSVVIAIFLIIFRILGILKSGAVWTRILMIM